MKIKTLIKSPWTVGFGLFSVLIPIGYDYFKNKPILSTIWWIVNGIWNFIISVLNFNLKVWWLIVGIIVIFAIIYFKQEETVKPDFYDYREGVFKRWSWTWDYKWDKWENAWGISDLTAYCPKCNTPLTNHSRYDLRFDCPRCGFRAHDVECDNPHDIERIIWDNVKRKRKS